MKTDLELVSEAFEAIKTVVERWEKARVQTICLPQDLAHLKKPSNINASGESFEEAADKLIEQLDLWAEVLAS